MKKPWKTYSPFIDKMMIREDVAVEQPLFPTHDQEMIETKFTATLKIASFISGSILAVLSQVLLYILQWDGSVLNSSTSSILLFSLQWSFLTLIAIFVGISTQKYFLRRSNTYEEIIFQLEAYNIAGALSALAVAWLLNDTTTATHHGSLVVVATLIVYGSFCAFVFNQSQSLARVRRLRGDVNCTDSVDASLHNTYRMIAALSGLLIGATTQLLVLSILTKLYLDANKENWTSALPLLLLWCFITASVTTLGLWGTRQIVARDHIMDVSQHKRLMLSVDSYYMQSLLIGMILVLILVGVLSEKTGRVISALALLILSVLACSARKRVFSDEMPEQELLEP
ncbi:hypothetical protein FisN_4Hu113 [Fistulifera solaris]|jgi:hypothetical protein|uniref:Uncharacterized protein n=1 Tax=Fistulifera solaris TaxID=1519565 RepID=A0A1Z5KEP7_FISSO|nr:hypothetical protein FisN_4Hu113 [Fistulifera solaris]|eukprot:GAX24595.1 hypothetical protein FisN_4Hu113 [Fistulifera solaris]